MQSTSKSSPIFRGTHLEVLDSEVGLANLDAKKNFDFCTVLSTKLMLLYSFVFSRHFDYQEPARKVLVRGVSFVLSQNNVLKSITSLVRRDRMIIIVGHIIQHDIRALRFA